jgi:hypothetical protein
MIVKRRMLRRDTVIRYEFTDEITKEIYSLLGHYVSAKQRGTASLRESTIITTIKMQNGRELSVHGSYDTQSRSTKAWAKVMWDQLVEIYGFKRV